MTLSTSAVAVCCCSDSESSRVRCCSASNSRVFSMAITAWVGEGRDEFDLLFRKRLHDPTRQYYDTNRVSLAQQWDAEIVR